MIKSKNFPIIFYFPFENKAGGVNILFLRLSEYLALNTNHPIYISDYKDGYMAKNNRCKKVKLLPINSDRLRKTPKNSLIVLQSTPSWHISFLKGLDIRGETRILFWNLHPYNFLRGFNINSKDIDIFNPNKLLKNELLKYDIELLDPKELFIKANKKNLKTHGKIDRHFNKKGHQIISEYLYPKIINKLNIN